MWFGWCRDVPESTTGYAPAPIALTIGQSFAQRAQSIRPVLFETVRRLTVGELRVLHCYRAPGLALRLESDVDDAAVGPAEPHRLGRSSGANFHAVAVPPSTAHTRTCQRLQ